MFTRHLESHTSAVQTAIVWAISAVSGMSDASEDVLRIITAKCRFFFFQFHFYRLTRRDLRGREVSFEALVEANETSKVCYIAASTTVIDTFGNYDRSVE